MEQDKAYSSGFKYTTPSICNMRAGDEGSIALIRANEAKASIPSDFHDHSTGLAQKGVIGVDYAYVEEDSRMVRNLIRNQAWSNPLRVRAPCPPLMKQAARHRTMPHFPWESCGFFLF